MPKVNVSTSLAGPEPGKYLVIQMEDRFLAMDIDNIVEIIRMVQVNCLPESSRDMAGVVNYRGEIIPVINLWSLLGQETPSISMEMGIVILQGSGRKFGMIAEKVLDVKTLPVEPRPDSLAQDVIWPLVSGVSYMDDANEMVLMLNIERLKRQKDAVSASRETES